MSQQVEELKIVLKAQKRHFDNQMNDVRKTMTQLKTGSKDVGKSFSGKAGLIPQIFIAQLAVQAFTKAITFLVQQFRKVGTAIRDTALGFERARSSIIQLTGATGDGLDRLLAVSTEVSKTVPQSIDEVAQVVGDLSTRLGLMGDELERSSKALMDFARVTKTDVTEATRNITRLMGDWSIEQGQMNLLLDQLTVIGIKSGVSITDLSNMMVEYGVQLRALGYTYEESIALMGKWEKEGVSARKIFGGLSMALGSLSEQSDDVVMGFQDLVDELGRAGLEGEAIRSAIEVLGRRAGPDFALAVREGRFELGEWREALEGAEGTLSRVADESLTFSDRMMILRNTVMSYLQPALATLNKSIGAFVRGLTNFLRDYEAPIRAWMVRVSAYFMVLAQIIQAVLSRIPVIGKYFLGFTKEVGDTAQQATDTVEELASGMDKVGTGAKGASDGVEELKGQLNGLAGFDELNVLRSPSGDAQAGGTGGVGDLFPDIPSPDLGDWEDFNEMLNTINTSADAMFDGFVGWYQKYIKPWLIPLIDAFTEFKDSLVELWDKWVKPRLEEFKAIWDEVDADTKIWLIIGALSPLMLLLAGVVGGFYLIIFVIGLFIGIIAGAIKIFDSLVELFLTGIEWMADKMDGFVESWRTGIGIIKSLWEGVSTSVQGVFTRILNAITDRMSKINNAIRRRVGDIVIRFQTMRKDIETVFEGMVWRIGKIMDRILPGIRHLLNTKLILPIRLLITRVNTALPPWAQIPRPEYIPHMARGGIVDSPTVAMVGEAGKEAVLPLENNTGWMDDLAAKIGGGGGHLTVQIGDDTIYDKAIDYIQNKGLRTGSNILRL